MALGEVVAVTEGRMGQWPWPRVGYGQPRMQWWPWLWLWCAMATRDGDQSCMWPGRDGGNRHGQSRVVTVAGLGWWLRWWCGHRQDDWRAMAMPQLRPAQDEVVAMV